MVALAMGAAQAKPLGGVEVEFFPRAAEATVEAVTPISSAEVRADSLEIGEDLGLEAASEEDLTSARGGLAMDDVQINQATNNASSSNNTVSGDVDTGAINATNVNNVSGVNTIMLNTGNNVTMQSITEVNIILNN
jgi:ABC-type nitrate/sulfonate/bicarbonate transport system substrate-binding protein